MSSRYHTARDTVRRLRARARHLRREALIQPSPVALAYRRRAAELELEARVRDERLVRFTPESHEPAAAAA